MAESLAAVSVLPGGAASYSQTTLTGANSSRADKFAGYSAEIFTLIGFRLGINRIYLGPIANFISDFDTKIRDIRVGGELRFEVFPDASVVPFTRLQFAYDQWKASDFQLGQGRYDFSADGNTFSLNGGVLFPVRGRILIAVEVGVFYGSLNVTQQQFRSGIPDILAAEKKNVFALNFGLNLGYRFFD